MYNIPCIYIYIDTTRKCEEVIFGLSLHLQSQNKVTCVDRYNIIELYGIWLARGTCMTAHDIIVIIFILLILLVFA